MEQRLLIKYVREHGHASTQIHSQVIEPYVDKALSYRDVSYWVDRFRMGEKALKIRGAAEDRQISKLISESRERSKYRPMLQFETLLRLPALLRQRYSISSLKFFIWNFLTGDGSHKLSDDQKRTRVQLAVSLQAELGRVQRRNWTEFYTADESWVL
jgi:hypothetical protein